MVSLLIFCLSDPLEQKVPGLNRSRAGRTRKIVSHFKFRINSKRRYPLIAMIRDRKNAHVVTIPPRRK
jgi:predicted site-specific integrase-resolvase